jgi:hypothetical protein
MEIHEGCAIERTVPFEAKGEAELLADEMGLVSHDRLYDTVVSMASRMAGREVWVPV